MASIAPTISRVSKTSTRLNYARFARTFLGVAGSAAIATYFYDNYKNNHNNQNNNNNKGSKSNKALLSLFGGASAGNVKIAKVPEGKTQEDYQKVYNDIATKIDENLEFDHNDGFYGQLVRLAWHTSGTYDKSNNSGGSYGGTMIFSPEEFDPENAGLQVGRAFLAEFQVKYPWISRGDLWTLAGVCAVQECGGPKIEWGPGRVDDNTGAHVPENGRMPDASKDGKYVRKIFDRQGFNERETVALIGAHVLGRCHRHNSGYDGPWGPSFNQFTNNFYTMLLGNWHVKNWSGKKQYEDDETNEFMMLPTDMSLKEEPYFLKYVKMYAKDQDLFFKDFSKAFAKLLSNGVQYPSGSKPFTFKTLDEQDDS
ncbi:Cytochrome c peroxidase, mitochondrial [Candida viswanathii]|uniref:Peroxidase n=1 Tax=Candida viswanathii TaxID=5486 RepID=A0A367XWU7_9ASCO|nr:Cytochrome c peroxidase, mitochondrial [Candida viswanathii]